MTLGKHLGCNSKNSKDLIKCLRTKSAEEIIGTDHLFKVIKLIDIRKYINDKSFNKFAIAINCRYFAIIFTGTVTVIRCYC